MTDNATPLDRRSPLALRFSLRMLLAAFTVFAIGFPVWYRWPYEEVELRYPERNGKPDSTQPSTGRKVVTWQRQWGGGRLKQGKATTIWNSNGQRDESTYRHGKRHGPRTGYTGDGQVEWVNQYHEDELVSETIFDEDGSVQIQRSFQKGKQHGDTEQHLSDGRVIRYGFSQGRVTHVDGQPIQSRVLDRLAHGDIDPKITENLMRPASIEAGDTLRDVLEQMGKENGISIIVHSRAAISAEPPDIDHRSDLASAIVLTARAAGCDCDCFNGCLWVLPDFGGGIWRDPTGISEIQPAEGTQLADAWNQSVGVAGREGSLAERLGAIQKELGIAIESPPAESNREVGDAHALSVDSSFLELRHALTLLLYHNRCRCELRDETLVILPLDSVDVRR